MCRAREHSGRRCEVTHSQRAAHNATRMMTRIAVEIQAPDLPESRRAVLREAFMRHCSRLRELRGMGEGQFPPVPEQVSRVSRYSPTALDRIPFETLDDLSMQASDQGDWAACEVLCLEIERREELAATYPDQMAADEQRRAALAHHVDQLDPVTSPAARTLTSARDRAKAIRAEYETYIELEILKAEEDTRGNLLNHAGRQAAAQGRAPTARALWTNHIVAQAYASEELRRYWAEHPRHTFNAWQEMMAGQVGEARTATAKSNLIAI